MPRLPLWERLPFHLGPSRPSAVAKRQMQRLPVDLERVGLLIVGEARHVGRALRDVGPGAELVSVHHIPSGVRRETAIGRHDVGGGGVGTSSDVAWRATGLVRYRPWDRVAVFAGWNVLDVDMKRGSGASKQVFDLRLSGPVLGVTYDF